MTTNPSTHLPLAIGAIVKEPPEVLLEWIAYHRVVGVDYFWIADNESGPTTRQLLLDLDRLGIINYIYFPATVHAGLQLSAYRKILDNARKFKGLLAFIDADEFLVPNGDSLRPFMEERFADENISALALNWANFGSNGALFAEEGLTIERFTRRAKKNREPNLHFKSILRPERVKEFINPHLVGLHQGRYVNADGHDLSLYSQNKPGMSAELSWNGARINHYIIKSFEEFLLNKYLRGSVSNANQVLHKKYFIKHDQNEEECLLAARFAPQVKAEIARLETKCYQLRSLIHPNLIRRYPKQIYSDALTWQQISPSRTEALKAPSLPASTAVLLEENLRLRQLLEELSIFNQRLFRSLQYRIGSRVGSLFRTIMLKAEKRSLPEIRIRQALKRFNQGSNAQ